MSINGDSPLQDNNNIENDNGICPQGSCMEMCPPEEATVRIRDKQFHAMEVTTSGYKLVKSYCWSAADSNMAVPSVLRPIQVLSQTVHYLLLEVAKRKDIVVTLFTTDEKKMPVMYDFLNDRLCAVRQDMAIQRLPPGECVVLLEPMIRFYVYYGYRLYGRPLNEFDPVLNKKYLLECMKWFLNCCDVLNKAMKDEDDIDSIIASLKSLDYCQYSAELSCDRILVESLYIICNLDDQQPLYRYLSLPKHMKRLPALKLAYDIAMENSRGNYIRVRKLAKSLCPLTFSALCLYIPTIQRRGLHVLTYAYNSKHLTIPVEVLRDWLFFNSYEEVRGTCAHYNLQLVRENHAICFNLATFIPNEQHQPRNSLQAKLLLLELIDILSYTVCFETKKPTLASRK